MIVRTRSAATLAAAVALVAAPVAGVGAATAQAATPTLVASTATNNVKRVMTLPGAPTDMAAVGKDAVYLSGAEAGGRAGVVLATASGDISLVTSRNRPVSGKVFLFQGSPYLLSGTTLYRLSGHIATQTGKLGGARFAVPTTVPGMKLPTTAPLSLSFVKAENNVMYFLATQATVPESPGQYRGVVTFDGKTWKGSMNTAALTNYRFYGMDIVGSSVRLRMLDPAYGFVYAYTWDGKSWTQGTGYDSIGHGDLRAYPGFTTAGSTYTYWGYNGAIGDGWRTPHVPLHGVCETSAGSCTPTAWPISAATEVSNDVVVLGGSDAEFGMTSKVPGGFAVVPKPGATPVQIPGENGDAVTLMTAAPKSNRVWAVTHTGTAYTLRTAVIDVKALGSVKARAATRTVHVAS